MNRKLHKYTENAHAKHNRELRAQIVRLQMELAAKDAEQQALKNEHSVVKSENKAAKPFLDRKGKGRPKKSGK